VSLARVYLREAHRLAYFDADETINDGDFPRFRFLKDFLLDEYDVIAVPRIVWRDEAMTDPANSVYAHPDWQARMTRIESPLVYVRKIHEQIVNAKGIYTHVESPRINHFHRSTPENRDFVGKLCAKLHMEDDEWGASYPEHHKEAYYRELYQKEGL
jgi:hypothetical protein